MQRVHNNLKTTNFIDTSSLLSLKSYYLYELVGNAHEGVLSCLKRSFCLASVIVGADLLTYPQKQGSVQLLMPVVRLVIARNVA